MIRICISKWEFDLEQKSWLGLNTSPEVNRSSEEFLSVQLSKGRVMPEVSEDGRSCLGLKSPEVSKSFLQKVFAKTTRFITMTC